MINPLTAILKVKNGELLQTIIAKRFSITLYEELIVRFRKWRSILSYEDCSGCLQKNCTKSIVDASGLFGRTTDGNRNDCHRGYSKSKWT